MLIRNVKNFHDLEMKKKLQAELLQVQINNESILNKRVSDFKNPNKPPPIPPQYKTVSEIQADLMAQQRQVIQNLRDYGLDYKEAVKVSQDLQSLLGGTDKLYQFNQFFPAIKEKILKFLNPKDLDAGTLMIRLEKFFKDIDGALGISGMKGTDYFNAKESDSETIIGNRDQYSQLRNAISQLFDRYRNIRFGLGEDGTDASLMDYIDRMISILPTEEDLKSINTLPLVERRNVIQFLNVEVKDDGFPSYKDLNEYLSYLDPRGTILMNLDTALDEEEDEYTDAYGQSSAKIIDFLRKLAIRLSTALGKGEIKFEKFKKAGMERRGEEVGVAHPSYEESGETFLPTSVRTRERARSEESEESEASYASFQPEHFPETTTQQSQSTSKKKLTSADIRALTQEVEELEPEIKRNVEERLNIIEQERGNAFDVFGLRPESYSSREGYVNAIVQDFLKQQLKKTIEEQIGESLNYYEPQLVASDYTPTGGVGNTTNLTHPMDQKAKNIQASSLEEKIKQVDEEQKKFLRLAEIQRETENLEFQKSRVERGIKKSLGEQIGEEEQNPFFSANPKNWAKYVEQRVNETPDALLKTRLIDERTKDIYQKQGMDYVDSLPIIKGRTGKTPDGKTDYSAFIYDVVEGLKGGPFIYSESERRFKGITNSKARDLTGRPLELFLKKINAVSRGGDEYATVKEDRYSYDTLRSKIIKEEGEKYRTRRTKPLIESWGFGVKKYGGGGRGSSAPASNDYWGSKRDEEQREKDANNQALTQQTNAYNNSQGRGMKKQPFIKNRIKIGKGITNHEEEPKFRLFGKFMIHMPQLHKDNILNLKYQSNGPIPSIKPVRVDDNYKEFVLDVIHSGRVNDRHFKSLTEPEQNHFIKITRGAGIIEHLKLKTQNHDKEAEELKRLELLIGEVEAGNDNDKMIKEAKTLIKKYVSNGRINKNKGMDMLMILEK
jgi:hypothetical protein